MLKQFPIQLAIKIIIVILFFYVIVYYLVFPVYKEIRNTITAIHIHYSGEYETIQSRVEKERALISKIEEKMMASIDSGSLSMSYYSFIRKVLGKRDIQTIKVNRNRLASENNQNQEVFSINFTGKYNIAGIVVNDLENGPFHCSIKELHLVAKSLIENTVEASLVVSFRRMAK